MTTPVALGALATREEDIDALLTETFLFPDNRVYLHRDLECLWGLEIYTLDPTHKRSVVYIRQSMQIPFARDAGTWALIPTEETLAAMDALQKHNFTKPVSERKSFLTEFSASEYEYIFVPLRTDVDFFILLPGENPRKFSAPYTDFPLVTSSANPFFVTFDARQKIGCSFVSSSQRWNRIFKDLTVHWSPGVIPDEFLLSCYPETAISESDGGSDYNALLAGPESKSSSDDTQVDEEGPLPVLAVVCDWVQKDAKQPGKHDIPSDHLPPTPRGERTRKVLRTAEAVDQWRIESKRGKRMHVRYPPFPSCIRIQ
ncbi:hypothetical protein C8R45DRAFT_216587 [Mycena sanguinolenta]|nr:hypothetical protein C8R45DRAFT_216587 [Mycena sanguinolenta]